MEYIHKKKKKKIRTANLKWLNEPYPGLERMHRQKSLKGPGTVLNGFPSKQAYTTDQCIWTQEE